MFLLINKNLLFQLFGDIFCVFFRGVKVGKVVKHSGADDVLHFVDYGVVAVEYEIDAHEIALKLGGYPLGYGGDILRNLNDFGRAAQRIVAPKIGSRTPHRAGKHLAAQNVNPEVAAGA